MTVLMGGDPVGSESSDYLAHSMSGIRVTVTASYHSGQVGYASKQQKESALIVSALGTE
jgi:hypothetical protein